MGDVRQLVVTADDFGIGPHTSRGILELATLGRITATVLLVNSPYAEEAVLAWRRAGRPVELGWHPCLTLDRPVLPPDVVPSLVGRDGRFWSLGRFLFRLCFGRIKAADVEAELRAQYRRFIDMVGDPPSVVNSHHHVSIFSPIGDVLRSLLQERRPLPYLRNVIEPWETLRSIPGDRVKRMVLTRYGKLDAKCTASLNFPCNDALIGITNARCVNHDSFFVRRLRRIPGRLVELTCHPGHFDRTLLGRDCTENDGQLARRTREFELLKHPSFGNACRKAGFTLVSPSGLRRSPDRVLHVA